MQEAEKIVSLQVLIAASRVPEGGPRRISVIVPLNPSVNFDCVNLDRLDPL